ncbi:hypothetical protein SAMN05216167_10489 [Spirosoma endophyticum]|uniref:Uncharacterized protein n=1 Tax=Spirosoma endophyticum TaxID=662367 RepID=A0A1I1QS08_9BACT|nr:hypothetical protein SAMN05216167_10489 [Spirosoma endophyticum]
MFDTDAESVDKQMLVLIHWRAQSLNGVLIGSTARILLMQVSRTFSKKTYYLFDYLLTIFGDYCLLL